MKGCILVADSVRMDESGKVSALGAGWNQTRAGKVKMGVMAVLRMSASEGGEHSVLMRLLRVVGTEEIQVLEIRGELSVGRDGAASSPVPLAAPIGVDVGAVDLVAGQHKWFLEVDGEFLDEWLIEVSPGEQSLSKTASSKKPAQKRVPKVRAEQ